MSCTNDLITPKGTLIYFNSGSIYTNCDIYTGLTSTSVTGITTCTGMTTGDVCDLQGIDANLMEIYVRLDCEGCCDKTYRINLDECLCQSPSPTPTPTLTPTLTPTPSITPSLTPSVTPTITPSPTPSPTLPFYSLGMFFGIAVSPTAGCSVFSSSSSPPTHNFFALGFTAVDFYTNPVGKTVYVDSPPFGFGALGNGYIVSSNGCRFELVAGVVQNAVACVPGGSCISPI
jgi:hypothetical protein